MKCNLNITNFLTSIVFTLCFLFLIVYSTKTLADYYHYTPSCGVGPSINCTKVFAEGVQSHGYAWDDKIFFRCDAKTLNNPTSVLQAPILYYYPACDLTCGNTLCSSSRVPAPQLNAGNWRYQSWGSNVTVNRGEHVTLGADGRSNFNTIIVKDGGTLTFAPQDKCLEYKIYKLILYGNAVVNLTPGYYWLQAPMLNYSNKFTINVVGDGTAILFTGYNCTIGKTGWNNIKINVDPSTPNVAKKLLLFAFNSVSIKSNVQFNGFIHSYSDIYLSSDVLITGSIAGDIVDLGERSVVTFDPVALQELDTGYLCDPRVHFVLSHSNNGIKCFKHEVTVTAKDSSNQVITSYNNKIELDTGNGFGTWYLKNGNGTFLDATPGDGKATYTFSTLDNGVAEFELLYNDNLPYPTVIDVEVYQQNKPAIRDDDTSGTITFKIYGYIISEEPFVEGTDPEAQYYNAIQTAGVADNMYITAYGSNSALTASCGIMTNYYGSKLISMWQDYIDPTTGTMTMNVNGTQIGNSEFAAVPVWVNFSYGIGILSTVYRDVGKLKFNIKSADAVGSSSTDNFVVKPARLVLNVFDNPGATDADGPVFKKAGDSFRATVEVQEYAGAATPNFGNEITPETVDILVSDLVLPTGGRKGSNDDDKLWYGDNLIKIGPGLFESTQLFWDEVGIIKLRAKVRGKYLDIPTDIYSDKTGNVGRFTPYEFEATLNNIPSFATGCVSGRFTYLGQPFLWSNPPIVDVVAKAKTGTTTKNYFGDFWKLDGVGVTQGVNSTSIGTSSIINPVTSPNVVSNEENPENRGTGVITYSDQNKFVLNKVNGTNLAPSNVEIQFETSIFDSDNVGYVNNPLQIGQVTVGNGIAFSAGNTFYQGRLNIKDSIGMENKTGTMFCSTEYYNGVEYLVNKADNCTVFSDPAYLELDKEPSGLDTTVSISSINNGVFEISLTPPSTGKTGSNMYVIVKPQLQDGYANLPWLQYDWEYIDTIDGLFDDNPAAKYIFGYRKGNESTIFDEEVL